jgi:hypothetical protein
MSKEGTPLNKILGKHPVKEQETFDMGTPESTSDSSEAPPLYEKQSGEPEQKNTIGNSAIKRSFGLPKVPSLGGQTAPSFQGVNEPLSSVINSEEFANADVDARSTSLNDSKNNDIGNNNPDQFASGYSTNLFHPWEQDTENKFSMDKSQGYD